MLARALLPLTLLALVACVYGDDTQWKTTLQIGRKGEILPQSMSTTIHGRKQPDGTCVGIVNVDRVVKCIISWWEPGLKVEVVGNLDGPAQLELKKISKYYPFEDVKVSWKPKDSNNCRGLKMHLNYRCILKDADGQANKGQAQSRVPNFPNFP